MLRENESGGQKPLGEAVVELVMPEKRKNRNERTRVDAILRLLVQRLMEDIECGRTKVSVGDLQRVMTLVEQVDRSVPKEIEVRWIQESKEGGGDE